MELGYRRVLARRHPPTLGSILRVQGQAPPCTRIPICATSWTDLDAWFTKLRGIRRRDWLTYHRKAQKVTTGSTLRMINTNSTRTLKKTCSVTQTAVRSRFPSTLPRCKCLEEWCIGCQPLPLLVPENDRLGHRVEHIVATPCQERDR